MWRGEKSPRENTKSHHLANFCVAPFPVLPRKYAFTTWHKSATIQYGDLMSNTITRKQIAEGLPKTDICLDQHGTRLVYILHDGILNLNK